MDVQAFAVQLWAELKQLNQSEPLYLRLASTPAPQAMLLDQQMITKAVEAAARNMVESDVVEAHQTLDAIARDMSTATAKIEAALNLLTSDLLAERSGEW